MGRTRPNLVEAQRQRFKCKQLLRDFCAKYELDPADIQGKGQMEPIMDMRKRFIRLAYRAGCGLTIVAKTVNRDITTVDYHVRGLRRVRRLQAVAVRQSEREAVHGG